LLAPTVLPFEESHYARWRRIRHEDDLLDEVQTSSLKRVGKASLGHIHYLARKIAIRSQNTWKLIAFAGLLGIAYTALATPLSRYDQCTRKNLRSTHFH
jgi:hypothetical protein